MERDDAREKEPRREMGDARKRAVINCKLGNAKGGKGGQAGRGIQELPGNEIEVAKGDRGGSAFGGTKAILTLSFLGIN